MTQTVLILGPTGRFGRHAATAFANAGWQVRRFDRARDDLSEAADGADVIVAGWNPEYQDWARLVPGLHAEVRRAALANNATVILPGNVYVYGPDAPFGWTAQTPHRATNPLGRIRIEMEATYRREGVRTIVLRAGDFVDTEASGNWFDKIMAPKLSKGILTYPGRTDVPHSWAFLPDLARAAVGLAENRSELASFADIGFPGYTITGHELRQALAHALGHPVEVRQMSWAPLHLMRPFMPVMKHLFEMRYLWNLPHRLEPTDFETALPNFPATPVEAALRQATAHLALPTVPLPA
ncbi:epimerase [Thalassobius sp. MITS945101]|uniref:epimerase n=1 Tax=Thalassobius sp. MITS945101 TaxID=3096994 RepID=UPI00399B2692